MTALRTLKEKYSYVVPGSKPANMIAAARTPVIVEEREPEGSDIDMTETIDLSVCDVFYPTTIAQRAKYRTSSGKHVTDHQWAVYDFACRIPCGKVTTYKDVCRVIGQGSPRSVGNALRNNPFAPRVPCHRVVASSLFVGGFCGEWGPADGTGKQCGRKIDMLAREGVRFTSGGFLVDWEDVLWRGN